MRLYTGIKLGPYEILAPIGAGGMGEVYRARDTKLKRDVALKVLPEMFANDSGRMMRFQREAEMLASLNHPNIAQIYGVEERALVMELVEGESPRGPMAFDDAWRIAMQIATALEYAHDRGVIHRDLKPANVKVTPDGVVKLLDFGLAKAFSEQPEAVPGDPSVSPTLTLGTTVAGTILGTAAYMSPEQARGKPVDKRADIWSWGVMLYELLTGERLFQGEDAAETLAAVIHKQPDLEKAPPQVRALLGRCLEKDSKNRLRDIGDARYLGQGTAVPAPALPSRAPLAWFTVALCAIIVVLTGFIGWQHIHEERPALRKLSFPAPEQGFEQVFPTVSVSPDGRRIAFVARAGNAPGVWIRDLDDPTPRKLADVVSIPGTPFWAPDSQRLGFVDGGAVKIVDASGSPPVTIANIGPNEPGMGSWSRNDVILVSEVNTPVYRIAAQGGSPSQVTELDRARNETGHMAPWFLPDGRHFLYVARSTDSAKAALYVGDLASTTRKQVLSSGTRAIYVNPGYLLFARGSTLMAQRFDAGKLETAGDAVPVAEQLTSLNDGGLELGHFSASQNGVLAYVAGNAAENVQLAWFDRKGNQLGTIGSPGVLRWPSLSPDESRVAYARLNPSTANYDVWIWDVTHGSESRFTSTADNQYPVWSSDGAYIFFAGVRNGQRKIYRKITSGTGEEEVVDSSSPIPVDASRDGRYLIASKVTPRIWVIPLLGDGKPFQYMASEFSQTYPRLSPDGHWLAYVSNETRPVEIYVVSFPKPGGKWQISTGGGLFPTWSHDGHELYYYNTRDQKMMAVDIRPGAAFQYGVPKPLFAVQIGGINTDFAVSKDGRFLLPVPVNKGVTSSMSVVLNWTEMLHKK